MKPAAHEITDQWPAEASESSEQFAKLYSAQSWDAQPTTKSKIIQEPLMSVSLSFGVSMFSALKMYFMSSVSVIGCVGF